MSLPILYSFRRCPYAMRARLAIAASDKQVALREIVLRDNAPEFLVSSPKATVPVLVFADGRILEESFDVMEWACGPSASPDERKMVLDVEADFKPWLDRYKYPNKFEDCTREHAIDKASEYLDILDAKLDAQQFLFGNTRGFADIGIAPFVRQFAHVDKDCFLEQSWSNVIRWYLEFVEWSGFKEVMQKYPKWVAGDAVTVFPDAA